MRISIVSVCLPHVYAWMSLGRKGIRSNNIYKSLIQIRWSRVAAVDSKQGGAINYELITARLMTHLPLSKWRAGTYTLRGSDAGACTSDARRSLPFQFYVYLPYRILLFPPMYYSYAAAVLSWRPLASVRPRLLVSRERDYGDNGAWVAATRCSVPAPNKLLGSFILSRRYIQEKTSRTSYSRRGTCV